MMITDVAWVRDHQHRCALQLRLDGHPAHILSSQRREYTRRGLLKGIDFLASEWRAQATHAFIRGPVEPGLSERDLAGCTDDPEVFALYEEMCQALLAGAWQRGPRPALSGGREPERGGAGVARTWTGNATTEALRV